jgi:hypothetical protein
MSELEAVLLEMLERLCNGLAWNIEAHPDIMNESDCEALQEARALIASVREAAGRAGG